MLVYLIILIIIVLCASPYSFIEQMVNTSITGLNFIIALVLSGVTWAGQIIVNSVTGLFNWSGRILMDTIAGIIGLEMPWDDLTPAPVNFEVVISTISFADMGIDTSFSPIGSALSSIFADVATANMIGYVGLGALAILVLLLAIKVRR